MQWCQKYCSILIGKSYLRKPVLRGNVFYIQVSSFSFKFSRLCSLNYSLVLKSDDMVVKERLKKKKRQAFLFLPVISCLVLHGCVQYNPFFPIFIGTNSALTPCLHSRPPGRPADGTGSRRYYSSGPGVTARHGGRGRPQGTGPGPHCRLFKPTRTVGEH